MGIGNAEFSEQQQIFNEFVYEDHHIKTEYEVGHQWYVICRAWFENWRQYIHSYSPENGYISDYGSHENPPGPIDVSSITYEDELKPGLLVNIDIILIPETLLNKFIEWYGVNGVKDKIPMRTVYLGSDKNPSLDLYPPTIRLTSTMNGMKEIIHRFNCKDTIGDVKRLIKKQNPSAKNANIILYDAKNKDKISDEDAATLGECSLDGQNDLLYDIRCEVSDLANGDGPSNGWMFHRSSLPIGVCGLSNLGNTCFMNSALQCMLNVPPLRDYFLSDQFKEDINEDNKLGSGGHLAEAFAKLVRQMWEEGNQGGSCVPRDLKLQIARKSPQFAGFQQHDAQELMNVLLDILNEDLNKIKNKPYIEVKDADGRSDDVVASESWSNYKKRNDSVIVEMFYGLLKSTVTCPTCNYVSVTFDPYASLSLPLTSLSIEVTVWPDKRHSLHVLQSCRAIDVISSLKRVRPLQRGHEYFLAKVHGVQFAVIPHASSEDLRRANLYVFDLASGSIVPVRLECNGNPVTPSFLISFGTYSPQTSREDIVKGVEEQIAKISAEFANEFMNFYREDLLTFDPDEAVFSVTPEDPIVINMPLVHPKLTSLDVEKHSLHLIDCLDLFLATEQLSERDPWYCRKCKAHRQAFKKFDIWILPRVLIIQLKRYSNIFGLRKNEAFVRYPENGLELLNAKGEKHVYDLVAVSNHMGGVGGGHYTAHVKNAGNWYNCDDSHVSPLHGDVVTRSAYCLVYVVRGAGENVDKTNGIESR